MKTNVMCDYYYTIFQNNFITVPPFATLSFGLMTNKKYLLQLVFSNYFSGISLRGVFPFIMCVCVVSESNSM